MFNFQMTKQVLPIMFIFIFLTSIVTPQVQGATSDDSESVTVNLSSADPKKAVALVPSADMPSVTLSSSRPINISHRNINNQVLKDFSVPDLAEAANAFPFNYAFPSAPFSSTGGIDYSGTSWLLFDSISSDSYGNFLVSTNHSALAIDDNADELFEVDPDYNFYLQISVGSAGPLSIRLNAFPDPGMGSRYEEIMILDPNGAPVQYYKYNEGDDEYFLLVAEKKGKYVMLIKPTDEKLFFNIQTSTYKPEKLEVEDELKLQIVGTPDSQLSQKEIDDAILTFDWYKYTLDAGDVLYQHFENIRGVTYNAHFAPNENNTGFIGTFGLNQAEYSKRSEYMLIIHDGTARYLLGVEKLTAEPLHFGVLHPDKLRANDMAFFSVNVSTPASVQIQITSESNGVTLIGIFGYPHQSYVTSLSDILGENTKLTNVFIYESTAYIVLKNNLPEEAWFEIRVVRNSGLTSRELKDSADMTPPYDIYTPNAYVDSDLLTFEMHEDLPGATTSHIFEYNTLFYEKQLFWEALVGFAFNASNDLVAQHSGETIRHYLDLNMFGLANGRLIHLYQDQISRTYSDSDDYKQTMQPVSLPVTFASSEGRYFFTVDSYLDNGSVTLPYESFCYFDIFTSDPEHLSYIEDIWFVDNVNQTNILLDPSEARQWMIKIPVEWMNWTDIELHFTNFTLGSIPVIIQNIRGATLSSYEFSYLGLTQWEMPSDYSEIGNVTTGFGSASEEDFVYLYLFLNPMYPGELSSLNVTLTRIPTQILLLSKEADLGGSGAPGFEWIWSISTIALIVFFLRKKRI